MVDVVVVSCRHCDGNNGGTRVLPFWTGIGGLLVSTLFYVWKGGIDIRRPCTGDAG